MQHIRRVQQPREGIELYDYIGENSSDFYLIDCYNGWTLTYMLGCGAVYVCVFAGYSVYSGVDFCGNLVDALLEKGKAPD